MATVDQKDAAITTVAVEVKVIKVGGKQMTLSLFRQVKKEQVLSAADSRCVLKGVPWGRVNYCPGDCDCVLAHDHVVWQLGGELRRCALSLSSGKVFYNDRFGRMSDHLERAELAYWGLKRVFGVRDYCTVVGPRGLEIPRNDDEFRMALSDLRRLTDGDNEGDAWSRTVTRQADQATAYLRECLSRDLKQLSRYGLHVVPEHDFGDSPSAAEAEIARQESEWNASQKAMVRVLEELPQLFIAV